MDNLAKNNIIGIVGGMGPYTGLDLAKKIYDQTVTDHNQGHLSIATLSFSNLISDRTDYLLGQTPTNPGYAIADIICKLDCIGATVVGIPCNTAHAPAIYDVTIEELNKRSCYVSVVHMIKEVGSFIQEHYPSINKVGVLCTKGSYVTHLFPAFLAKNGIDVVQLDQQTQEDIHRAIYDPDMGIKRETNTSNNKAKDKLMDSIKFIKEKGAQAIILGCTEIPLVITEKVVQGVILFDPAFILARALIKHIDPKRLKTY